MATRIDIEDLINEERERYEAKLAEFAALGKKPFRWEEHGPGIAPQDYYDSLRDPGDPDYKPAPAAKRRARKEGHA